jgi:hypothetical protein
MLMIQKSTYLYLKAVLRIQIFFPDPEPTFQFDRGPGSYGIKFLNSNLFDR